MERKYKFLLSSCCLIGSMFGITAALILVFGASAQNLFVSNYGSSGGITEIASGGVESKIASGLANPSALALTARAISL